MEVVLDYDDRTLTELLTEAESEAEPVFVTVAVGVVLGSTFQSIITCLFSINVERCPGINIWQI